MQKCCISWPKPTIWKVKTRNALRMLERLADRHPYYTNISEAYFRMGDIYFNQQRYAKAEYAYRQTTEMDGGKLSLNSHYMFGLGAIQAR